MVSFRPPPCGTFISGLLSSRLLVGVERIGAAAEVFANQRQLVEHRIEGPQRQAKAALAAGRAVARAAVAALLREGGQRVELERDRLRLCYAADFDRHDRGPAGDDDRDLRLCRRCAADDGVFDGRDVGCRAGELAGRASDPARCRRRSGR